MISEQWFVKMAPLAEPAIAAVKANEGEEPEIQFIPQRWEKVYLSWLENVRDWCISRQLWWGHRIPVWYDEEGNAVALETDPEEGATHPESGKPLVRQDEDVLDTWASSWLWPFSTLGWPDDTAELQTFYPTQFLSTARDIIYLWVARMVMAGYEFVDTKPFSTVYIHATILDAKGQRMSKSRGNGIDPLDMIEQWGVDAVRLTLPMLTNEGQDIKLSPTKFEMGRNFCNKIWNASRFILTNLDDFEEQLAAMDEESRQALSSGAVDALEDRFILGRLQEAIEETTDALDRYRFNDAAFGMYRFVWDELCDWYLETCKARLYQNEGGAHSRLQAQATLVRTLESVLTMLHPMVPFITEEIWDNLRPKVAALHGTDPADCLLQGTWPTVEPTLTYPEERQRFDFLRDVTRAIRSIRAQHNLDRKTEITALVRTANQEMADLLGETEQLTITHLAQLGSLEIGPDVVPPDTAATAVIGNGNEVYVNMEGLIDYADEIKRIEGQYAKLEKEHAQIAGKLKNVNYVERAPAEVVQRDRDRVEELSRELETLSTHADKLRVHLEDS